MSAPTSLLASTNQNAAAREHQQQLINNLYATTFSTDSIEITNLEQQLLKSSSNKQLNKQQVSHSLAHSSSAAKLHHNQNHSNQQHVGIIEKKFNELARKVFEELRDAEYSVEFFKAVDEIIGEPIGKARAHKRSEPLRIKREFVEPRRLVLEKVTQTELVDSSSRQLQSLPIETSHPRYQQQQQPAAQFRRDPRANQKSSIPTSTIVAAADNSSIAASRATVDVPANARQLYQINKSATTANCQLAKTISVQKSSSGTAFESAVNQHKFPSSKGRSTTNYRDFNTKHAPSGTMPAALPISDNDADSDSDDDGDDSYTGHCISLVDRIGRNFGQTTASTSKGSATNGARQLAGSPVMAHPQADRAVASRHQQQTVKQQKLNPIARSHTISVGDRYGQRQEQQQQQQQQQLSSLVTSSAANYTDNRAEAPTISALRNINNYANLPEQPNKLAAVNILKGKDAAASLSLYKPHMNYSTSVLGNHRLSDDDEIIIIPTTQSPSSMISSTSPDNSYHYKGVGATSDGGNADELTERFSISRTKSFWEMLSKGSGGKRDGARYSPSSSGANDNVNANVLTSNSGVLFNPLETKQQHQKSSARFTKSGGSGANNTFDRMDSAGGSNNSNYSCSSSGEENNSGAQSHHAHPTVTKFIQQELNRQNKFRQTR